MKKVYAVEAIEKFRNPCTGVICRVHTRYLVEATSAEEAEELCKSGRVAYDDCESIRRIINGNLEDGDDWLETIDVEETEFLVDGKYAPCAE